MRGKHEHLTTYKNVLIMCDTYPLSLPETYKFKIALLTKVTHAIFYLYEKFSTLNLISMPSFKHTRSTCTKLLT